MDELLLKRTTSTDADFRLLIKALDRDLRVRNGDLMDVYDGYNVIEAIDTVVIAYVNGEAAGCGCFKTYSNDTAEIKRMFVLPESRGKGLSIKILNELEGWACESGFRYTILETGSKQAEALRLYQRAGYLNIAAYPPYQDMPDSICFKKRISDS